MVIGVGVVCVLLSVIWDETTSAGKLHIRTHSRGHFPLFEASIRRAICIDADLEIPVERGLLANEDPGSRGLTMWRNCAIFIQKVRLGEVRDIKQ